MLDVGGQVVAAAVAMRTDPQGIGFAVPAGAAFRLLAAEDLPGQDLLSCGD